MSHELVKLYQASSVLSFFHFLLLPIHFSRWLALEMKRFNCSGSKGEYIKEEGGRSEALRPLILFLNAFGFHLEPNDSGGRKNKIFALIHSTSFLIVFVLLAIFTFYFENNFDYYYGVDGSEKSIVINAISYINCSCIYLTLIIISVKNIFASIKKQNLQRIFKCFDNIDAILQTTFSIKCSDNNSRMLVIIIVTLLLLFLIIASAVLIVEVHHFQLNKKFNAGRCIYGGMVYILSVEISLYCVLVNCIKARFCPLCKYLRKENKAKDNDVDDGSKSSHVEPMAVAATTKIPRKLIMTENVQQLVSRVEEEISLIYDEVLEIISLLNESFSTLLSSAFSKYFIHILFKKPHGAKSIQLHLCFF